MSIIKSTSIICNAPQCAACVENIGTAAEVRAEARKEGWRVRVFSIYDLCPDHEGPRTIDEEWVNILDPGRRQRHLKWAAERKRQKSSPKK